jgi:hypothetical protein
LSVIESFTETICPQHFLIHARDFGGPSYHFHMTVMIGEQPCIRDNDSLFTASLAMPLGMSYNPAASHPFSPNLESGEGEIKL